jgi:hypothetical protein
VLSSWCVGKGVRGEQGYDMVSIWLMSSKRNNSLLEPVVSYSLCTQLGGKRVISQEGGLLYLDLHGLCKLNCLSLEPYWALI